MPWSPPDRYLWDFWFAERGSELHLFFLQAPRQECGDDPERRHELASVGHAVLTPRGWKEIGPHPAFRRAEGRAWDNTSIWTGSIIRHPISGLYTMLYTSRHAGEAPVWTPRGWFRPQHIGAAVSADLISWRRTETCRRRPVISNPGKQHGCDGVNWRDPYLVRGRDGLFYAFISTRRADAPADSGGAIVYLTSSDLERWSTAPQILIASTEFYQMEVPQVFFFPPGDHQRLYLLFSAQAEDCSAGRRRRLPQSQCQTGTYYLVSPPIRRSARGFPPLEEPARLLAPGWYGGKIVTLLSGGETVFFGFRWKDAQGRFAGGLSDPLPVRFDADGFIHLEKEV